LLELFSRRMSRTAQILGNEPFRKWTQFCGNNILGTRIPQNFG